MEWIKFLHICFTYPNRSQMLSFQWCLEWCCHLVWDRKRSLPIGWIGACRWRHAFDAVHTNSWTMWPCKRSACHRIWWKSTPTLTISNRNFLLKNSVNGISRPFTYEIHYEGDLCWDRLASKIDFIGRKCVSFHTKPKIWPSSSFQGNRFSIHSMFWNGKLVWLIEKNWFMSFLSQWWDFRERSMAHLIGSAH